MGTSPAWEGGSTMACALVPWNAKELMPVIAADWAEVACLGSNRLRPAVLLLKVASK